jgi:hypothetical protein
VPVAPALDAPALATTAPAAPALAQIPVTPVAGPVPVPVAGPWRSALFELGLPAELALRANAADPYQAVLTAVSDLRPPAPPARPGDILVVVGPLARAMAVVEWAAATLRLDPEDVLVAGPPVPGVDRARRISGPVDAERRARRMHRADTPHIVVVDAPVDGTDGEWVRDVCDGLAATAVWVVIDATRKPADTARYLRRMGTVDALAAYAVGATGDPGSLLELGPPVALLDGRPATAHAWAGLLSGRLLERDTDGGNT